MRINPEFRRYLWLEMGWMRLGLFPVILFVFFQFVGLSLNPGAVLETSIWIMSAGLYVWGTWNAAYSVLDEISQKTWDWQKTSALSPWRMTWAKIMGSTVHVWYAAAIIVVLMIFHQIVHAQEISASLVFYFQRIGLIGLTAIGGYAVAIFISLLLVAKDATSRFGAGFLCLISGLAFISFITGQRFFTYLTSISDESELVGSTVIWYGQSYDVVWFNFLSLLVLVAWIVFLLYRLMRSELQYKSIPWDWAAFLIYLCFFIAGLTQSGRWLIAAILCIWAVYLAAFSESHSPNRYQDLLRAVQAGRWKKSVISLPRWIPVFLVFAVVMIGSWVKADDIFPGLISYLGALGELGELNLLRNKADVSIPFFVVLSIILFVLRDIVLLITFNASGRYKRPDLSVFVILLLFYFLAVPFFYSLYMGQLTFFFAPAVTTTSLVLSSLSCVSALAQIGVMSVYVYKKIRVEQGQTTVMATA